MVSSVIDPCNALLAMAAKYRETFRNTPTRRLIYVRKLYVRAVDVEG